MRNRIIAIVLIVVLIPCCLVVPVGASESVHQDSFSLLTAVMYNLAINSSHIGTFDSPMKWVDSAYSVKWSWDFPINYRLTKIVINFQTFNRMPDSTFIDTSSGRVSGTFVGAYQAGSNLINSQWLFEFSGDIGSNLFSCGGFFTEVYSGDFSIVSASAYVDDTYFCSAADVYFNGLILDSTSGRVLEQSRTIFAKANYALPAFVNIDYQNTNQNQIISANGQIRIDPEHRQYTFIDSMTFLIYSLNVIECEGFRIVKSSDPNSVVSVLNPDEYIGSVHNENFIINGESMYGYCYEFTVDLSGYDLRNLSVEFSFNCEVRELSNNLQNIWILFDSVYYRMKYDQLPWYISFSYWLNHQFDMLKENLTSGFQSVVNAVSSVFNPDGSNDLSQAGEDLSQSAGDIDAAGDVLGSVDQPDLNSGDLIGGLTTFDSGGLRVLSSLTSNAQVTDMLIVVFTFSLAGYIFFGKKR